MAIEIGLGEVAALQEKLAAIVDNNGFVPDERLVQAHVIYGQVIGSRVFWGKPKQRLDDESDETRGQGFKVGVTFKFCDHSKRGCLASVLCVGAECEFFD